MKIDSHKPEYRRVALSKEQACYVEKTMQEEGRGYLQAQIEILELGEDCRALIWVWSSHQNHRGNMGCCKLSSAQWIECMLHLEQGSRPVYTIRWDVYGKLQDGCWAMGQGRVVEMHHLPQPSWGELEDLTGISESA